MGKITKYVATKHPGNRTEQIFWEKMLTGISPLQAAKEAGSLRPAAEARIFMLNKDSRTSFRYAVRERIMIEGAGAGVELIVNVIRNKEYHIKVRLDAAKFMVQAAGMLPKSPDAPQEAVNDKALHEMTKEELRAIIDNAEDVLAKNAKPIGSSDMVIEDVSPPKSLADIL